MEIVTDEERIKRALEHARKALDISQQGRGNFVKNAIITRDIEAVEQGDYSEVAIKRLENE